MPNYRELDEVACAIVDSDSSTMAQFILQNHCDVPISECERCSEFVHHDESRCVDDETVCESCSSGAYYWESDGEYHWEEERNSDEYPEYHSSNLRSGFKGAVGIELELKFHDEPHEVMDLAESSDICLEQDSSLDESNSAEAITHPFLANREGLKKLGGLHSFLENVRASGWNKDNYGIHVNLNRGSISNFDVLRAMQFIVKNAEQVARVAGRDRIYSGSRFADTFVDRLRIAKRGHTGKYSPINLDGNRVEFRIYQANAKSDGVRAAVRFSQDVIQFASEAGYRGLTWSSFVARFPQWVDFRVNDHNAVSV
tara:strand:- start:125 stop:1063 length:939 start_codon:yes stop_codon:yes gene_type:complete